MIVRFIATVIALTLMAGCAKDEKKAEAASTPKAADPIPVQTARAETRQMDRTISVTGSLNPDESVTMSFEVPGRIQAIHVDFGQTVRKGQVLAELDSRELSFQLERTKAAVVQALARLGLNANQENVTPESTPGIRQAAAQMEDAKSKFDNATQLVKTGDISNERYVEIEKSYRARQAALEAARDEVRTQLASIRALQADVKLAEKRLADTVLRAPFDGAITQKSASAGQYMKENTPVLTLVKTTPIRLRVDIPEAASSTIKVGSALTFTTDAAPGAKFSAIVKELNATLDAKSRSLTAEARLASNDPRLRPGLFVQVELVVANRSEMVFVPREAVYTVAGLTKMFVIRDGKAVELKITPGQESGGWVEVPGGKVQAGDTVAVSALQQLIHGAPVRATGKV